MNSKKGLAKKALAAAAAFALTLSTFGQTNLIKSDEVVKAAGNDNYAKLLQQSLFFYDANMCGKTVESEGLMQWRGNCHTSDDVDGGFHDAGDHAVFGLPQGYSASTLGWAYYEFKDSFDSLGVTGHYKTLANHFATFFRNSTELDGSGNVSRFLYQKGDGDEDHAYWGAPENQSGNRRMFWTSNSASDIAAEYAAALAVNYINFGNKEDLKYAEALYKFSTQNNSIATDGPNGFYKNSSCQDEQAWAAGWLYLATKKEQYKNDCASKQAQYLGWVHGWENVDLGSACLYAEITGDWSKVNSWIGGQATGNGYYFLDKWGSARLNASMQFTALVASKHSNADYTSWCKGQMDYLLGNNPRNVCFVCGFADNSAKHPHHRAASGMTECKNDDGYKYTLVGALVGGPTDAGGTYTDDITDYVGNEVALDYNAGLVGAAAGLYAKYKTGSVESSIVGAKSNGVGGAVTPPVTEPTTTVTTAPPKDTQKTTTASSSGSTSQTSGGIKLDVNKKYVYSELGEDERMIGFKYSDFGLKASDKISKVEVNISSSKNIGKWEGAFGTSTTVSPDYWTMTDNMSKTISSNSGTITWELDAATTKIVQTQYGGEVKFGVWWIDCDEFTIDSVVVYTEGGNSGVVTQPPTSQTTTASTKATTVSTNSGTASGGVKLDVNKKYVYSELGEDERMIGFKYSDFGLKASDKVSKVEVNISSSKNIGKWEGAFGTSTTVSPEYWTMTDNMSKTISGNSGTITWELDAATTKIVQTQYGGEVKFGVWWIDCDEFTIDSVVIYTEGGSSSSTTTTTKATTVTTKAPVATTTTTKATTVTTKAPTTTTTTKDPSTNPPSTSDVKGDVNSDGSVTATDVVSLMQALVGKKSLDKNAKSNADLNNDGKISIVDLIKLKNMLS